MHFVKNDTSYFIRIAYANSTMKTLYQTIVACLLFLMLGCAGQKPKDDARLKKNIVIDGINVSAMTVLEARTRLAADAQSRLERRTVLLVLPDSEVPVSFHTLGARLDVESAITAAARLRSRGGARVISTKLAVDMPQLTEALRQFVQQYERPASNAALEINASLASPVSYKPEQTGLDIDDDALLTLVSEVLQNGLDARVVVPCTSIAPETTEATLLASTALVAQYTTEFDSKTLAAENRVFNMQKAADRINGMELAPAQTFDCNAVLGDRTEENGWKTAPGIRNGRYEDEYGGGVCQISSTLFNAVLMADLTITERHPHSWPMGYVDIGRDATISTGGKNFCFVNDSGAPLKLFIHVDTDARTVTASIYGKPLPDGQYIEITSEKTGTLENAGQIVMLDESLPYQTESIEREARDGKTSVTYKEYHAADGSLLRREVAYKDTYKAIDGLTYVSTDLYYGKPDETAVE